MSFTSADEVEIAFYDAFENAAIDEMMMLWADNATIGCIHPLGPCHSGKQAVRDSWRQIFRASFKHEFKIEPITKHNDGQFAVHVVFEFIRTPGVQTNNTPILATNAYQLIDDCWYMVLHHASPLGQALDLTEENVDGGALH